MGYFLSWLSLSKPATNTALDISEGALLLFGLLLVVGIFGEYKKVPRWMLWPKLVFETLVMVSVAGELLADGGVFLFSRHLQSIDDADLASLSAQVVQSDRGARDANNRAAEASKDAMRAQNRADITEHARVAMLEQLRPRDFTTSKQVDDFTATVKGKVTTLDVFTLADPEAAYFGGTVVQILRRADVKVSWHPLTSVIFPPEEGLPTTGLVVYAAPSERSAGTALAEAFAKVLGQSEALFTPTQPIPGRPSPSLYIGLKQPPFFEFPEYLRPEGSKPFKYQFDPK